MGGSYILISLFKTLKNFSPRSSPDLTSRFLTYLFSHAFITFLDLLFAPTKKFALSLDKVPSGSLKVIFIR